MARFMRVELHLEDKDLVLKGPVSDFIAKEYSVKWNLEGHLRFSIQARKPLHLYKYSTSPIYS